MRELASSDEALKFLKECVEGEHGPKAAVSAHRHVAERGYGKEAAPIDVRGDIRVTVEVVNEVG